MVHFLFETHTRFSRFRKKNTMTVIEKMSMKPIRFFLYFLMDATNSRAILVMWWSCDLQNNHGICSRFVGTFLREFFSWFLYFLLHHFLSASTPLNSPQISCNPFGGFWITSPIEFRFMKFFGPVFWNTGHSNAQGSDGHSKATKFNWVLHGPSQSLTNDWSPWFFDPYSRSVLSNSVLLEKNLSIQWFLFFFLYVSGVSACY